MRGWGVSMETNLFVYIISHITITGYKTKTTTSALHAFKIHHKLSVVSSLNNVCPYPKPALTHLSGVRIVAYFSVVKLWFTLRALASAAAPDTPILFPQRLWKRVLQN